MTNIILVIVFISGHGASATSQQIPNWSSLEACECEARKFNEERGHLTDRAFCITVK